MKKILAIICIILTLLSLCACGGKKQEQAEVIEQSLEGTVKKAYVGETKIADKDDVDSTMEIHIKERTFYVNGIKFSFSDFEKHEKLSQNYEDGVLSVYVKDGQFQKCTVSADGGKQLRTYNADGKCIGLEKQTRDEYGNITSFAKYDEKGDIVSFYVADYEKEACRITEKKEYDSTYTLAQLTRYYYDDSGKLTKEAVYGPDLKLIEVKDAQG